MTNAALPLSPAGLQPRLGHIFSDISLLETALTHRSFQVESKTNTNFERLEFLGDAVLGLILSEALMKAFPKVDEGMLSKCRASLVNETTLSEASAELQLSDYLRLGKSEHISRKKLRPRLLASAFEAVLGAIYLDGGLEKATNLVAREFEERLKTMDVATGYPSDFKTRLQEWAQKKFRTVPEYRLVSSQGPEHAKTFVYDVFVGDMNLGQGSGSSRKSAEQEAARNALEKTK